MRGIDEVDTPALLVDRQRLDKNIASFSGMAKTAGVSLRPHVKTHKTIEIARRQLAAGSRGITVAKLSEAEAYVDAGITDIFVAYPVVGEIKWRRAADLNERARVAVGVDSATGIRGLAAAARRQSVDIGVRVELDSGLGRTGVAEPYLEELCAEVMRHDSLRLEGVFTFRSSAFPGSAGRSVAELGADEGGKLVAAGVHLRKLGFPVEVLSGGSTPTARAVAGVGGVTEVRPGTYVFHDLMTLADGACSASDLALSVLTTVVSRRGSEFAMVDAGSKTLAGDCEVRSAERMCLAETLDGRGGIAWLNEEHGALRLSDAWSPTIGERIRLTPAHVCTVVNLADQLLVMEDDKVVDEWRVAARGCNR